MLKLSVTIQGKTESDLELALTEVTRLVAEGYTSGRDSNEDGNYVFEVDELSTQPGDRPTA